MLLLMEKTVLIVTDGAESTQKIAEDIKTALKDCHVVFVKAGNFEGTQLLPADLCFFGAENPELPSFSYLYKVLKHINLVNRPCGVFASSKKAADYLSGMVEDSEMALYPDPFLGKGDIKTWTEKVASGITK